MSVDFITYSDLKTEIGIAVSDTTKDVLLTSLASEIMSILDQKTGRNFAKQAHTEYYNAYKGMSLLELQNWPVDSTATFELYDDPDWDFDSGDLFVLNEDFVIDWDKGIIFADGSFSQGNRSIKVIYTAGYNVDTFPSAWKKILIRQAAYWYGQHKNKTWGISSITNPAGSGTVTFKDLEEDLLPDFLNLVRVESR